MRRDLNRSEVRQARERAVERRQPASDRLALTLDELSESEAR